MDKKRTFVAVVLVAILALIIVLILFKPTEKSTPIKLESNETKTQEEVTTPVVEENTIQQEEKSISNVSEAKTQKSTKYTVKKVEKAPAKTSEVPLIKPLQVKEDVKVSQTEEIEDAGIVKETSSNDIVITKEFKFQTPAKYSFEGYGVQRAPVK